MNDIKKLDLDLADILREEHGPAAMYDYLASFGYVYPKLANGVVNGDSLAGNAAIRHMVEIAEKNGITIFDPDNLHILL